MVCRNTNLTKRTPKRNKNRKTTKKKNTLIWSYFCINRNSAKTLRGLPGKNGTGVTVSAWSAFAVSACVFNATSKMPPKKLPRLEKGQKGLVWVCQFQSPRHQEHSELLGWTRHSKQAAGCQAWPPSSAGQSWAAATANLSPTNPSPPPGFSQPLTPPPTNTLSLCLPVPITLFPSLLLPLPICFPVHNLHLSSQLLPAFTVFKRTF